jgi:hypothetical protein
MSQTTGDRLTLPVQQHLTAGLSHTSRMKLRGRKPYFIFGQAIVKSCSVLLTRNKRGWGRPRAEIIYSFNCLSWIVYDAF